VASGDLVETAGPIVVSATIEVYRNKAQNAELLGVAGYRVSHRGDGRTTWRRPPPVCRQ
jgi:hypothetical protein